MSVETRQFVEGVLLVFAALLPIVNPFGGAPVFLAMTADCTPDLRKALATRVARNAFVLLFGSIFVGSYVLAFFGLSVDLLRQESHAPSEATSAGGGASDIATRAFYPLTLPLTVGPGTISVAITLGANHATNVPSVVANAAAELIGVTLIAATILVCYRYADRMLRMLGPAGTGVLVRLSAFILLCIGVQIFWNGVSALLDSLPWLKAR